MSTQTLATDADRFIALNELIELLGSPTEYAFIDVRETVSVQHSGSPLVAAKIPVSRLEVDIGRLVPRRSTPIVLTDGGAEQTALSAAATLRAGGYSDVRVLRGGTEAWRAARYELYNGPGALGQAFGEWVEAVYRTPSISAFELTQRLEKGENIVLLDSRPLVEFEKHSVPGARSAPGAELVHRTHGAIDSEASLVVVNCAGRTRAILGAQALITAGFVDRPIASLENGTQGWVLAGAKLAHGRRDLVPASSAGTASDAAALAGRLGVRFTTREAVEQLRQEKRRTVFVFDIRTPEEFAAGHYPGARSVPSWELVPGVFRHAATRNAHLVLVDAAAAERAVITAWWLCHIGWGEVSVLAGGPELHTSTEATVTERFPAPLVATIDVEEAARLINTGNPVVIDVGSSLQYQQGRVPGAWFAVRSRLPQVTDALPSGSPIIVTSDDGQVAFYAAAEIAARTGTPAVVLEGGTAAWIALGKPLDTSPGRYLTGTADFPGHVWSFQGDRQLAGFRQYLAWEISLTDQVRRDVTSPFRVPESRATAR